MKTLVVYYSNSGNNNYLAQRIGRELGGETEAIKPRLTQLPFQILFSLIKMSPGIKRLKKSVGDYDVVVLCGPVWMGQLVSPLRTFLKKYQKQINKLCFATCNASTDAQKETRFGYSRVFAQVKSILGEKLFISEAFPVGLTLPEDKREESEAVMKARLSDDTFTGEMQERFDAFVGKVKG